MAGTRASLSSCPGWSHPFSGFQNHQWASDSHTCICLVLSIHLPSWHLPQAVSWGPWTQLCKPYSGSCPQIFSSYGLSRWFIWHTRARCHTHAHTLTHTCLSPGLPYHPSLHIFALEKHFLTTCSQQFQSDSCCGLLYILDFSLTGVTVVYDSVCVCVVVQCLSLCWHVSSGAAKRVCILLPTKWPVFSEVPGAEVAFNACGIKKWNKQPKQWHPPKCSPKRKGSKLSDQEMEWKQNHLNISHEMFLLTCKNANNKILSKNKI